MADKEEYIEPALDNPTSLAYAQPVNSAAEAKSEPSSSTAIKLPEEKSGKGGELQVEEQEHHEHKDQISPELEALLHTDPTQGLSDQEVEERLAQFGPNELKEVKKNPILKFLGYFTGAIAYLIEVACIISAVVKDWLDFGIILALLMVNACIGFIEEAKAESALDALRQTLALKTRCWRNGHLIELDTSALVPGDVIVLRLGDIIPADGRLLGIGATGEATEGDLLIDQSALTGESLPVSKKKGDVVYSSSIVKQGQQMAVVTKTGINTFIGRAANLISITVEEGHFQKIINRIGNFLIMITVFLVGIIMIYQLVHFHNDPSGKGGFLTVLRQVLVLTVAAIPVGLPTVMSVTMAVGAKQLAAKKVIVKRLTAVEEMASVSVLCSDKTGTLTLNELTFDEPYLADNFTSDDILLYSYLAAEAGANDPIELAVRTAAEEQLPLLQNRTHKHEVPGYKVTSFLPFNPATKLTQATITKKENGMTFKVAKGAPQVIIRLVGGDDDAVRAVNALAKRGLRALGVARTREGSMEEFELIGMIALIDPPRPDSAETIARCRHMGVDVKMVTGDQLIIAKEVSHRLGLTRVILDANHLVDEDKSDEEVTEHCLRADGFAQVIPEHKYRVVELLQKRGIIVGMTGDGVNDAPALKKANVGIAVHGCTDAARSAADIVLLAPGLSTIVDGLMTSRAIFQRMRSYALYRITSTVHFLMFFFIVVMAYDWSLPAHLLILICILNDLATLVISVDNAQLSPHPDKWRIGQLISMSIILGICLTALSFAHFFTFWKHFGYAPVPADSDASLRKLESVMYLHISSAPHFVIFSTRLTGYFWENLPSPLFACVIIGTQIVALLMVVFGGLTPKIPFSQAIVILLISFAYFILLDVVKVQIFKIWSFELTAAVVRTPTRRKKLAERKARKIQQERVWKNIDHVREMVLKLKALEALNEAPQNGGEGKEEMEILEEANPRQGASGGSARVTPGEKQEIEE
ncbi:H(+)-ATPase [Dissophora ornata]|nr:hypothetical protein BGZ58_009350 [Dissophora ornata]KAI8597527.1 H(+)-ATPase [Dissophora ornata]